MAKDLVVLKHLRMLALQMLSSMTGKIGEAAKTAEASGVKFADGETFQAKYDAGELTGPKGDTGPQGPRGNTGAAGATGPEGPQGEKGEQGPAGKDGAAGPKGDTGDTWTPSVNTAGLLSWTKNSGTAPTAVNIKGPKGDTGDKGDPGPQGATGPQGAAGAKGVTFTPKVSSDGVISWTNDGGLANPTEVNIKGPKGDTGPQGSRGAQGPTGPEGAAGPTGPQGPAGAKGATGERGTGILKITTAPTAYTTATGGVTPAYRIALSTVKSQSGVSTVLVGDVLEQSYYHYPVIYLDASYVYTGAQTSIRGATGAAGAQGPKGDKGDAGPTGPQGNTGPKGDTGLQGPAGAAATIAVGTVTTGAAGTAVSVTNAGTASAAKFNFTIPRGADGKNGTNGTNGKDGAAGPNVVSTSTASNITGLLKGEGGKVAQAVAGTDYVTPSILDDLMMKFFTVGATIQWAGYNWIIVFVGLPGTDTELDPNRRVAMLACENVVEMTMFDDPNSGRDYPNEYQGSKLQKLAKAFEDQLPAEDRANIWRWTLQIGSQQIPNVGVYAPLTTMLTGMDDLGWYFKASDDSRICKDKTGKPVDWWTCQYGDDDYSVDMVLANGQISTGRGANVYNTAGFRPFVGIYF